MGGVQGGGRPGPWHLAVTPERPPAPSDGPGKRFGGGGGSNYPLTGWKHYVFEGGVRSAAFVFWPNGLGDARAGTQHHGLFHATDWLPTIAGLAGADTSTNLPLDGVDIWPALLQGGTASPRAEVPIEIGACGPDAKKESTIVDGPQAAMIVGELKVIVDCWWRSSKNASSAQLYNLTADAAETKDLAQARPDDVKRLLARLDFFEQQSVGPYKPEKGRCGQGKPQKHAGLDVPVWLPWC